MSAYSLPLSVMKKQTSAALAPTQADALEFFGQIA
jgi:hypothetical protein